jgi:hypothetical protein
MLVCRCEEEVAMGLREKVRMLMACLGQLLLLLVRFVLLLVVLRALAVAKGRLHFVMERVGCVGGCECCDGQFAAAGLGWAGASCVGGREAGATRQVQLWGKHVIAQNGAQ